MTRSDQREPIGLERWMHGLEERHMADLRFAEVVRALRALSAAYVEQRGKLPQGAALDGAGKRAAFALFYGPLHFLVVSRVLAAIDPPEIAHVLDLGCGTGAAGSAWALSQPAARRPTVHGIDRHPWAVGEARWTYRTLELRGRAERTDAARVSLSGRGTGVVAGYTVNEMSDAGRDALLGRLLSGAARGARVLIVEPIARRPTPWWPEWREAVERAGGRYDTWRFEQDLPDLVRRLDTAAGLDHRELTAKSLWL